MVLPLPSSATDMARSLHGAMETTMTTNKAGNMDCQWPFCGCKDDICGDAVVKNPHAVALGSLKSAKKALTSAANGRRSAEEGKKGGRPKKAPSGLKVTLRGPV